MVRLNTLLRNISAAPWYPRVALQPLAKEVGEGQEIARGEDKRRGGAKDSGKVRHVGSLEVSSRNAEGLGRKGSKGRDVGAVVCGSRGRWGGGGGGSVWTGRSMLRSLE